MRELETHADLENLNEQNTTCRHSGGLMRAVAGMAPDAEDVFEPPFLLVGQREDLHRFGQIRTPQDDTGIAGQPCLELRNVKGSIGPYIPLQNPIPCVRALHRASAQRSRSPK